MSKGSKLIVMIVLAFGSVACVHTEVGRIGRMPLNTGKEGLAPVIDTLKPDQERVALLSVDAPLVGKTRRQLMHLRRRASLLGCDGVTQIVSTSDKLTGVCVRSRTSSPLEAPEILIRSPSHALVSRVAQDTVHGSPLLKVLHRISQLPADQRAWPLEWYLEHYPASPYAADIENLFVAARDFGQGAGDTTLRAGPR